MRVCKKLSARKRAALCPPSPSEAAASRPRPIAYGRDRSEILSLEALMLEGGLIPSPFFRFPGLVSNRQLIEELRAHSLIPIGSNAWLAKSESPQPGSVILVHASGNEPEGIRLLLSFYGATREAFRRGDAAILPLRRDFLVP